MNITLRKISVYYLLEDRQKELDFPRSTLSIVILELILVVRNNPCSPSKLWNLNKNSTMISMRKTPHPSVTCLARIKLSHHLSCCISILT
jgi:hypothetical protein